MLLLQNNCSEVRVGGLGMITTSYSSGGNKLPRWRPFLLPASLYLYVPRIHEMSPFLLLWVCWFVGFFLLQVLFAPLAQKLLTTIRIFSPRLCIAYAHLSLCYMFCSSFPPFNIYCLLFLKRFFFCISVPWSHRFTKVCTSRGGICCIPNFLLPHWHLYLSWLVCNLVGGEVYAWLQVESQWCCWTYFDETISSFLKKDETWPQFNVLPSFPCQNIQCVHRIHTENKETHKMTQFEMFPLTQWNRLQIWTWRVGEILYRKLLQLVLI